MDPSARSLESLDRPIQYMNDNTIGVQSYDQPSRDLSRLTKPSGRIPRPTGIPPSHTELDYPPPRHLDQPGSRAHVLSEQSRDQLKEEQSWAQLKEEQLQAQLKEERLETQSFDEEKREELNFFTILFKSEDLSISMYVKTKSPFLIVKVSFY